MNGATTLLPQAAMRWIVYVTMLLLLAASYRWGPEVFAQPAKPEAPADPQAPAEANAQAAPADTPATERGLGQPGAWQPQVTAKINLWQMYLQGGVLMIPITAMSFLGVIFGVERALGLRRRKVLPGPLLEGLTKAAGQPGALDVRQVERLCQEHPSTAANVVRAMLLKAGRPYSEVEHAVSEASEREAAKLYSNVRWLNLCASVTPLMGLLGTVQGMIQAFFVTAHLPTGANKAQSLSQGIYIALVTTFGGLTVAIPCAILAHFFEGRIQRLFRDLDETLQGLMPHVERWEGPPAATGKDRSSSCAQQPAAAPK